MKKLLLKFRIWYADHRARACLDEADQCLAYSKQFERERSRCTVDGIHYRAKASSLTIELERRKSRGQQAGNRFRPDRGPFQR